MKKIFLLSIFSLFLSLPSFAQKEEEKAIKKTFEDYKSAIMNDKGSDAAGYVDSRTILYYTTILDLVKNGDSVKVSTLPMIDKLMVFRMRHSTPREDIYALDGKGLLVYAIDNGMVGKNSVEYTTIGKVVVDKEFAKGQFVARGQETPFDFHFYKQEGQWKVDLTSLFPLANMGLKGMMEEGQDENEFILSLLEMLTGTKPGPEVWQPVK